SINDLSSPAGGREHHDQKFGGEEQEPRNSPRLEEIGQQVPCELEIETGQDHPRGEVTGHRQAFVSLNHWMSSESGSKSLAGVIPAVSLRKYASHAASRSSRVMAGSWPLKRQRAAI